MERPVTRFRKEMENSRIRFEKNPTRETEFSYNRACEEYFHAQKLAAQIMKVSIQRVWELEERGVI